MNISEKNTTLITSKDNKWLKICSDLLKGRSKRAKEIFIAEGSKLIKSILPKYKPLCLLTSESFFPEIHGLDDYASDLRIVSDTLWKEINELDSPVKLMALFEKPNLSLNELNKDEDYLILDRVQDPGNMGTLIRTAVAAGWQNLICLKGTTDPFSAKVVRASAGALADINIFTGISLEEILELLNQSSHLLINTSSHTEMEVKSLKLSSLQRLCLVLGNEGQGSSQEWQNNKNYLCVKLPIKSQQVESLNVSIAGSLLLYKLKNLI